MRRAPPSAPSRGVPPRALRAPAARRRPPRGRTRAPHRAGPTTKERRRRRALPVGAGSGGAAGAGACGGPCGPCQPHGAQGEGVGRRRPEGGRRPGSHFGGPQRSSSSSPAPVHLPRRNLDRERRPCPGALLRSVAVRTAVGWNYDKGNVNVVWTHLPYKWILHVFHARPACIFWRQRVARLFGAVCVGRGPAPPVRAPESRQPTAPGRRVQATRAQRDDDADDHGARGQLPQPAQRSAAGERQEGRRGVKPLERRVVRGELAQVLVPAATSAKRASPPKNATSVAWPFAMAWASAIRVTPMNTGWRVIRYTPVGASRGLPANDPGPGSRRPATSSTTPSAFASTRRSRTASDSGTAHSCGPRCRCVK